MGAVDDPRDDEKQRRAIEEVARQEVRERLRTLMYSEPDEVEELERVVDEFMTDKRGWVEAGHGKPGLCLYSYPKSLLDEAGFPEDRDCADSLLTTEQRVRPNHLCLDTAKASTRLYATAHFPPKNQAQEQWVNEWPFPVGKVAMEAFANREGLHVHDLPPAPDREEPTAALTLWLERIPSQDTGLTFVAYAEYDKRYRHERRPFLGRPTITITHASQGTYWARNVEERQEQRQSPRRHERIDHTAEWVELDEVMQGAKNLVLWYEKAAHRLNNELRGRPEGGPALEKWRPYFSDAVREIRDKGERGKIPIPRLHAAMEVRRTRQTQEKSTLNIRTLESWLHRRDLDKSLLEPTK